MLVRDIMNKNVVVSKKDATLKEASEVMSKLHIGSLLIVDKKKIAGIITHSDIVKAIAAEKKPDITLAEEIMSKKVVTIEPDKKLDDAVSLMIENKIKKLPVVEEGKILGIVTASDIVVVEPKLVASIANLLSLQLPGYKGG